MGEQRRSSEAEIGRVRERVQELVEHARADPAFRERLRADPEATLAAEGIPDVSVSVPEVAGYMVCAESADPTQEGGSPTSGSGGSGCLLTVCSSIKYVNMSAWWI